MTKTVIELGKDGTKTVFHRRGDMAWTHKLGERYSYVGQYTGEQKGQMVTVPCDCQVALGGLVKPSPGASERERDAGAA